MSAKQQFNNLHTQLLNLYSERERFLDQKQEAETRINVLNPQIRAIRDLLAGVPLGQQIATEAQAEAPVVTPESEPKS